MKEEYEENSRADNLIIIRGDLTPQYQHRGKWRLQSGMMKEEVVDGNHILENEHNGVPFDALDHDRPR